MMKLYYSPGSCSLAVHVVLEEIGADYELASVRTDRGEQRSPDHLARNPLGRVPVLETPQGLLTEVPAILGYLASSFPDARLAPADPFELARMNAFNAFISSTLHVHWAHFNRPARWTDDEAAQAAVKEKAVTTLTELFAMVNDDKLAGPWVMGGQYTTADPYLFAMTRWLARAKLEVTQFPRVAKHLTRMVARPAVRRTLEQEGLEQP